MLRMLLTLFLLTRIALVELSAQMNCNYDLNSGGATLGDKGLIFSVGSLVQVQSLNHSISLQPALFSNQNNLVTEVIFNEPNTFSVYPNPTSDFININTTANQNILKLLLFDSNGKLLLSKDKTESLSIKDLKEGKYELTIISDHGTKTISIIKL